MKQFSYVLTYSAGLHVKPTGALAREASRFKCAMYIYKGEDFARLTDTKALLALGVRCGDTVRVTAEGIDEEAAIAAVQQHFVANL